MLDQADTPRSRSNAAWIAAAIATALIALAFFSWERQSTPEQKRSSQAAQAALRRADRGEALIDAALNQLRDLPAYVTTELRLPEVVLDSTKSSNGQDVLARCTANRNVPDGLINYFTVPAGNARFRSLGVRPGDQLKFYAAFDQESLDAGFERRVVIELNVAQVLGENELLIEGGLNQEVLEPEKIEIWRLDDDRLVEISRQLRRYDLRRLPSVGWQPSADAPVLQQIVSQINQWVRQSEPKSEWRLDPLLKSLEPSLADNQQLAEFISAGALSAPYFQPYDGRLLQEAVWARDISRWARGNRFDKLAQAEALFDWTVRNIQLQDDGAREAERPWQTLLYGRGTAEQRAWVFALLCRQQGLDVIMLGIRPDASAETSAGDAAPAAESIFWLPALLADGQLYLFDTRLGLAVPGPGHKGVATLAQVQADDSLLRQLDLEGAVYPVTAEQLKNVVAYIVADPFDLSRRVRQLEAKLSGDDKLVLSVRPSEFVATNASLEGVQSVQIWDFPFRILADQLSLRRAARNAAAMKFEPFAWRPTLWKARTRQFQGRKAHVDSSRDQSDEEATDDHREAARLYMGKSLRPTDREIAASGEQEARIRRSAKLDAGYWLGLLSFDEGRYDVAAYWLGRDELSAADSPWTGGARYNLARTLEAQGKLDEAAKLLSGDTSPQQHGNKLRAKWLSEPAAEYANETAVAEDQVGE